MNTDQEPTTTTAGEAVAEPTAQPEATTEQPAEAAPAKPVETATPEPVTPKAVKEAPKSIGDNELYKTYRRLEAKVEKLTKLTLAQAKNSGAFTEEEQAAMDAEEKAEAAQAQMETFAEIVSVAKDAGTTWKDPSLDPVRERFAKGKYDEAIKIAKSILLKEEKPVDEKMFTKAEVMEMAKEEAKRLMDEEKRKTQKFDPGLPSGKAMFTRKQLAEMSDEEYARRKNDIDEAERRGQIA